MTWTLLQMDRLLQSTKAADKGLLSMESESNATGVAVESVSEIVAPIAPKGLP